ncbi:MAG: hemerythrin domain-containing protein [Gammaproteobacteria bacterium]|nr:MAG: hemerythrin domain-containing protein [Gammaproteobacteria bacterium]
MTMPPDALFPTPAPGFDDPLGLLRACHTKMLQHAALLQRLVGLDPNGRDFATLRERACRYFDHSAPLHHEDEERDLFPALLRRNASLATTVRRLQAQHPELERRWQAIRAALHALPPPQDLSARIEAFVRLLRDHLALEETDLLAPAETLLDAGDLERLGRAMAARRGVD